MSKKLKGVSVVLATKDGKALVGRRRDTGKFTVPGGHLNEGEDPRIGAARELEEESGIKVDPKKMKKVREMSIEKKGIHLYAYRVELPSDTRTTVGDDPDAEVKRWQWVALPFSDNMLDDMCIPREDNIFLDYLDGHRKIAFYNGFEKKAGIDALEKLIPDISHLPRSTKTEIVKSIENRFGLNGMKRFTKIIIDAFNRCQDRMYFKRLFEILASSQNKNTGLNRFLDSIGHSDNSKTMKVISGNEFAMKMNSLLNRPAFNLKYASADAVAHYKEKIEGGKASGLSPKDFDPKFLKDGIKVEMEHTKDQDIAREIAMDHGAETGSRKSDGKIHSEYYNKRFFDSFEKKVKQASNS